jgi:hypothetical protein
MLGTDLAGNQLCVPVYGTRMLLTGEPTSGKSQLAQSMLEQLMDKCYQTCVIDPKGDYQNLKEPTVLGSLEKTAAVDDVIHVLEDPDKSCVVNLVATPLVEQPSMFARILRALMDYRGRTGRPHWYIIDDAHYPLSMKWQPAEDLHLEELRSVMYISAFPEQLPETVLRGIDLFVAIGNDPAKRLAEYCELLHVPTPKLQPPSNQKEHQAIAWWRSDGQPAWFKRLPRRGNYHPTDTCDEITARKVTTLGGTPS